MTDKELLELAAKAAGIEIEWKEWVTGRVAEFQAIKYTKHHEFWSNGKVWNPLLDDGDALRLAVKLRIELEFYDGFEEVFATENTIEAISQTEPYKNDPYAATRRAIVRAAAEIGRTMG